MKTLFFYFFSIAVILILAIPVYNRPVIRAETEISTPSLIKVHFSYIPTGTKDSVHLATFSVKGRQKLRFAIQTPELSAVNINFEVHTDMNIRVGSLHLRGQNKKTFFPAPGRTEIVFPVEKDETFSFNELSFSAARHFDPVLFIFTLISASLLFFALKNSRMIRLLSAAAAGYTGFSLSCDINPAQLNMLFGILIFSFLFFFYNRIYTKEAPLNFPLAAAGIIFGTVNLLSLSLYRFDSWDFIAQNALLCVTGAIGQGVLFYAAGLCFFKFMSGGFFFTPCTGRQYIPRPVDFYRRHTVLCAFLIILACWLLWHFIYFLWDFKSPVKPATDLLAKSQRHPVLSTFLLSACFQAGSRIKDYNPGIYFYTALQSFFCAFVFALCLNRIKQLGLNFYFQLISLIFFSVYPVGGFIAVWDMKDTLYAGMTTLFILQTLSGLHDPEKYFSEKKQLCAYAVVFLLVCLLRRNGIFVVLPTTAALLLFSDIPVKTKKITALLTGTAVCCFFLLNQIPSSKKEALSFQTHLSDVTASHVKKTYPADHSKTALKLFFRRPLKNIQATMTDSFGYYAFTPYFVIERQKPFIVTDTRTAVGAFYNNEIAFSLLYAGVRAPIYTWLLVLLGLYVYTSGRRKKLLYLTASAASVLVCIASPLNGLPRLYLPVITAMPVVFAFCAVPQTNIKKQTEEY